MGSVSLPRLLDLYDFVKLNRNEQVGPRYDIFLNVQLTRLLEELERRGVTEDEGFSSEEDENLEQELQLLHK